MPGRRRNNTIDGCPSHCIQTRSAVADVSDNTLHATVFGTTTKTGIDVTGGSATVSRNVLVRRPGTPAYPYAFQAAGIQVSLTSEAVTLTGNSVADALSGLRVHSASPSAFDNTFGRVQRGIEVSAAGADAPPSAPSIHRNDFLDYQDDAFLLGVAPPHGFATCNYWGRPTGPVTTADRVYYTPFSTVPIANRPAVICP